MAKTVKNRLFKIQVNPRLDIVRIEAENARDAIEMSESAADRQFLATEPINVSSEPIYERTLITEYEDTTFSSENSVFEIVVRGTSDTHVDQMAKAIAMLIGGPAVDGRSENNVKIADDIVSDYIVVSI